jgi:hypothetical protein
MSLTSSAESVQRMPVCPLRRVRIGRSMDILRIWGIAPLCEPPGSSHRRESAAVSACAISSAVAFVCDVWLILSPILRVWLNEDQSRRRRSRQQQRPVENHTNAAPVSVVDHLEEEKAQAVAARGILLNVWSRLDSCSKQLAWG